MASLNMAPRNWLIALAYSMYCFSLVICQPDVLRLLDDLLGTQGEYDVYSRPVSDVSRAINVTIAAAPAAINSFDLDLGVLDISMMITLSWKEDTTQWRPQDYGEVNYISIPEKLTWSPDITVSNIVNPSQLLSPSRKILYFDGRVTWARMLRMTIPCMQDPASDSSSVLCEMVFMSWTYDGFHVDIVKGSSDMLSYQYSPSRKWKLVNITADREVIHYSCCVEPWPTLKLKLELSPPQHAASSSGEDKTSSSVNPFAVCTHLTTLYTLSLAFYFMVI